MKGLNALSSGMKSIKGEAATHYYMTNSVFLFGMLENKVSSVSEEEVMRSLPMNWVQITNGHLAALGRIWIMWNPVVFTVFLWRCTSQVVSCSVVSIDG